LLQASARSNAGLDTVRRTKGGSAVYRHILIGLNQSDSARRALLRAIHLAAEFDATLTAMTVVQAPPPYAAYAAVLSSEALQMTKADEQDSLVQLLESAQREAAQHAIKIKTILSGGPVVASLIEAVRKNHIDLLVLGIHAEHGLFGWLTASTAHELALKAACDILGVH
jgi:nucleotide-binding universal stress UspA family protein